MELAIVSREITPLAEVTGGRLKTLSDQDLLARTRRLVGASNQLLAELLAHLAEVEARGVHRVRLCTSLYTYCIYELRFSEDAAFRRVSAARLLQRFPALYDVIASGELHLTGLLQVGPHLTPQNFSEVLNRAKHRTKKELTKLVRELDPLPDVPARIEPLGPALPPPMKVRNPTWEEYMRGLTPVNHLLPGDRPRDWMSDTPFAILPHTKTHRERLEDNDSHSPRCEPSAASVTDAETSASESPQPQQGAVLGDSALAVRERGLGTVPGCGGGGGGGACEAVRGDDPVGAEPAWRCDEWGERLHRSRADEVSVPETDRREGAVTLPQRFAVQFTASQEYVDLVARAQALISHTSRGELEELHLRAMELLVAELEKKKFATTTREPASDGKRGAAKAADVAAIRGGPSSTSDPSAADEGAGEQGAPHGRGRYIPAAVRRAVLERDGLRCTHTDETGARCAETHRLEFHHVHAFARGGEHTIENVTLRCRAHNDLAAEVDFGVEKTRGAKEGTRHESLVRQTERTRPPPDERDR